MSFVPGDYCPRKPPSLLAQWAVQKFKGVCVHVCVSARSVTYEAVNMDPADVGCTVSNSEMVVIAAVVKVGVGGACVREEEPQVKGEAASLLLLL